MKANCRGLTTVACAIAATALAASPAIARTTANTKDGKPNILVVMTDDQAAADVYAATQSGIKAMPNLQALVAAQGATFTNAVDSFPLCCPSRATFITGQYAHNHGVGGNFFPYGWYGMQRRDNTLPVWLHNAGYYTSLVGKWLNGYGSGKGVIASTTAAAAATTTTLSVKSGVNTANGQYVIGNGIPAKTTVLSGGGTESLTLSQTVNVANGAALSFANEVDAGGSLIKLGGEVPAGFDNWNGGLDVSFYDYFNFQINQNGKVKSWGDSKYAAALTSFAEIQIMPPAKKSITDVIKWANKFFKNPNDPSTYGTELAKNYEPDVTAGLTNTIIKSQAKSKKPFFMWWAPVAPHREDVDGGIRNGYRSGVHYAASKSNPRVEDKTKLVPDPRPAPRYSSLAWNWSSITSKPSFDAAPTGKSVNQQLILANPMSELDKQRLEANYSSRLSSIKAVDDGIKTLIDTLKSTKQLDNTIIVFTSDNGWLQGEHRVPGDKYLPYEESIRVPFVIRGPGIPANRQVTSLVSNVDFAATLIDAAKATSGRTLDGVSLLGAAKGTSTPPLRAIGLEATAPLFADASMPQQWDQSYKGVRTDQWKYVEWAGAFGEKELYNLVSDPYELNNLSGNPTYTEIQASLAEKMATLSACAGSGCTVSQ